MKVQKVSHKKLIGAFVLLVTVSLLLFMHFSIPSVTDRDVVLAAYQGADSNLPAIDFELPDLDGSSVRLSKFKGDRPVLLYFWATWCPYCITVKPEVAKLRQKVARNEMEILAINVGGGDSIERLRKYREGHPSAWPILYDGDGKVSKSYKVQGIPLFILVNKAGNIVYRDTNPPSDIWQYLEQ